MTGLDVLLLLAFMEFGFRKIEAIILALVATVFACFLFEIRPVNPDWGAVAHGMFVPDAKPGCSSGFTCFWCNGKCPLQPLPTLKYRANSRDWRIKGRDYPGD